MRFATVVHPSDCTLASCSCANSESTICQCCSPLCSSAGVDDLGCCNSSSACGGEGSTMASGIRAYAAGSEIEGSLAALASSASPKDGPRRLHGWLMLHQAWPSPSSSNSTRNSPDAALDSTTCPSSQRPSSSTDTKLAADGRLDLLMREKILLLTWPKLEQQQQQQHCIATVSGVRVLTITVSHHSFTCRLSMTPCKVSRDRDTRGVYSLLAAVRAATARPPLRPPHKLRQKASLSNHGGAPSPRTRQRAAACPSIMRHPIPHQAHHAAPCRARPHGIAIENAGETVYEPSRASNRLLSISSCCRICCCDAARSCTSFRNDEIGSCSCALSLM